MSYIIKYTIYNENVKMPKHIFFSGYKAPSIPRKEKRIYLLPNDEFIKEIIELGGTPQEVVDSKELLQLFTPILRNDFKMLEKYLYKEKNDKIQCDISILNGEEDDITIKEILTWKNHGDKGFKVYNFEGNHFFINTNVENITKLLILH